MTSPHRHFAANDFFRSKVSRVEVTAASSICDSLSSRARLRFMLDHFSRRTTAKSRKSWEVEVMLSVLCLGGFRNSTATWTLNIMFRILERRFCFKSARQEVQDEDSCSVVVEVWLALRGSESLASLTCIMSNHP